MRQLRVADRAGPLAGPAHRHPLHHVPERAGAPLAVLGPWFRRPGGADYRSSTTVAAPANADAMHAAATRVPKALPPTAQAIALLLTMFVTAARPSARAGTVAPAWSLPSCIRATETTIASTSTRPESAA